MASKFISVDNGDILFLEGSGDISISGDFSCAGFTSTGIDDNATSTALTLESSQNATFVGNVGIPLSKSYTTYTSDYGFGTPDSDGLQIFSGDVIRLGGMASSTFTEYVRIDSSGKVGIGVTPTINMDGLSIESGLLTLKETTTPTADTNYGKIYTKTDNKIYFQDGAGTEHEIAFV